MVKKTTFSLLAFLFFIVALSAQQPQAQQGQPIYATNAKWVQGVGPGYYPTKGTGLTLNLAAGTAYCGNPPVPVFYAGGTLALTASQTNYVYLDPAATCVPAFNITGFAVGQIPLAKVVTGGSAITSVTDVRTWFVDPNSSGPVIRADLMPGADAGAKIAAAIAALPATGGTVDARGLEGAQTILAQITLGSTTKPVTLVIGDAQFSTAVDNAIVVPAFSHLIGSGNTGLVGAAPSGPTIIQTGIGTAIQMQDNAGDYAFNSVENILVRSTNGASTGNGITVASGSTVSHVHINGFSVGIRSAGNGVVGAKILYPFIEDTLVQGIYLRNVGGVGTSSRIVAPIVRSCTGIGIQNDAATTTIIAPTVDSCSGTAILMGSGGGQIIGGHLEVCNKGIVVTAGVGPGPLIESPYIASMTTAGIHITSNTGQPTIIRTPIFSANPALSDIVIDAGVLNAILDNPYTTQITDNGTNTVRLDTYTAGTGIWNFTGQGMGITGPFTSTNSSNATTYNKISNSSAGASAVTGFNIVGDAYHASSQLFSTGYTFNAHAGYELVTDAPMLGILNNNAGGVIRFGGGSDDWASAEWARFSAGNLGIGKTPGANAQLDVAKSAVFGLNVVTFSATPTFDANLGNTQKITLTANVTSSTLSNATAGETINFIICQDATGSRTFVWPTNVLFPAGASTAIGATASKCSTLLTVFDGTNALVFGGLNINE